MQSRRRVVPPAVRLVNPKIRFYQASSSEMFGQVAEIPQTEKTPFHPRSPYELGLLFCLERTYAFLKDHGQEGRNTHIILEDTRPWRGRHA